jgi:hypothetical protein
MRTIPLVGLDMLHRRHYSGGDWLSGPELGRGRLTSNVSEWGVVEDVYSRGDSYIAQILLRQGDRLVKEIRPGQLVHVRTDFCVDLDDLAGKTLAIDPKTVLRARVYVAEADVPLDALTVGTIVSRWTDDPGAATRRTHAPCCGRPVDLADIPSLPQMTTCCKDELLFSCELVSDIDGGFYAVFQVLATGVNVAKHRPGKS